jgi:hypothetical protein
LTNPRHQLTRSSERQKTRIPAFCISVLDPHMKTSHFELWIANGSIHISGTTKFIALIYFCCDTLVYSGFRSSFDRGCLSLWFNFRRNVSSCFDSSKSSLLSFNYSFIANKLAGYSSHWTGGNYYYDNILVYVHSSHKISKYPRRKRCLAEL